MSAQKLNLSDLKSKSPKDLLSMAEELEIENASTMRKGEMMFQILRERADEGWEVFGEGVLEEVRKKCFTYLSLEQSGLESKEILSLMQNDRQEIIGKSFLS